MVLQTLLTAIATCEMYHTAGAISLAYFVIIKWKKKTHAWMDGRLVVDVMDKTTDTGCAVDGFINPDGSKYCVHCHLLEQRGVPSRSSTSVVCKNVFGRFHLFERRRDRSIDTCVVFIAFSVIFSWVKKPDRSQIIDHLWSHSKYSINKPCNCQSKLLRLQHMRIIV